ncbi:MAG: UDP-N-acetylmuramate dehydrogenase [Bryobacteraceae bacterium]
MESPFYAIPGVTAVENAPLRNYTRFELGGPARVLVDALTEEGFRRALAAAAASGEPWMVLGGGSNLIVSDAGFDGTILRYRGSAIGLEEDEITVEAGAELEALVDFSIEQGLDGLHTLKRIPGWVGGAVYGNAGAYGHSLMEFVTEVRFVDLGAVRRAGNAACEFAYRESAFKRNKQWAVVSARLRAPKGDEAAIRARAEEIRSIRDAKFPPTLRCAGSIFKNCFLANLPERAARAVPPAAVIEGKVPAAWFLERVGAKGERRGEIQVASYHANLLYNDAPDGVEASAFDARALIEELKERVRAEFGLTLEEEVQSVGFNGV